MMSLSARFGVGVAGAALVLAAGISHASPAPLAPGTPGTTPPTTSANASFAPTNPVDCTDPNNTINCSTPPIDSPLVVGTAPPGSPFRD
ncbi:MAG: hypothetical protein KDB71_01785 [Mycobacterium sp.]|nr:hypothetical protein [Mycobacterium sp.]